MRTVPVILVVLITGCLATGPLAAEPTDQRPSSLLDLTPTGFRLAYLDPATPDTEPAPEPPPAPKDAWGGFVDRLQLDIFSEYRYARYNFTDVVRPYNDFDGLSIFKLAYWADDHYTLGPYGEVRTFTSTEEEFFFLRFTELTGGFQWYLLDQTGGKWDRYIKNLRFFVQGGWRDFWDPPEGAELFRSDFRVGFDYYYDNLFKNEPILVSAFTEAAFRKTNFSISDYNAFFWFGIARAGPKLPIGNNSLVVPYALTEWTYAPQHDDRFFENFLRLGVGVRWYPHTGTSGDTILGDMIRRFHIFTEVVQNVAWLGDRPRRSVESSDYRIGISFTTSGNFRP